MKQIRALDDDKELNAAATDERALKALFSLKKDDTTEPLILNNSVVIAQLLDERNVSGDELAYLDAYYAYLVDQFRQESLYRKFLDSDKLKNNFLPVFSEKVLRTN